MTFILHLRKDLSRAPSLSVTEARRESGGLLTWTEDDENACLAGSFVDGLEGAPVVEVDDAARGVGQAHYDIDDVSTLPI